MKSFAKAKAILLGRHQTALADAQKAFDAIVARINADHKRSQEAYERQWDEVKSNIDHPELEARRQKFEQTRGEADHSALRHALAKAVYDADNEYHAELRKVTSEHGITMSAPPLNTRGI
jgi:hypothetical protein